MHTLAQIESRATSQNGEDGILTYLIGGIKNPNRQFLEIGAGSGRENNTTNLIVQHGYCGIVVERKISRSLAYTQRMFEQGYSSRVLAVNAAITPALAYDLALELPCKKLDVFSLDIDSYDWWVMRSMLQYDMFQPTVLVLEYNSAMLSEPWTVPCVVPFKPRADKLIDYGCGVVAWKHLLEPLGYAFVTVDSAGVNAFFVKIKRYDMDTITSLTETLCWTDCVEISKRLNMRAEERFSVLRQLEMVDVRTVLP